MTPMMPPTPITKTGSGSLPSTTQSLGPIPRPSIPGGPPGGAQVLRVEDLEVSKCPVEADSDKKQYDTNISRLNLSSAKSDLIIPYVRAYLAPSNPHDPYSIIHLWCRKIDDRI